MPHHHVFSTLPRIFCSTPIKINSEISLEQGASHHLLQVLRLKIGDYLVVFNGDSGEYVARLVTIDKKVAHISIEKFQEGIAESSLKIHLGQSMARGEKMDFIMQKAVELGVHEITPLFSEFCNVRLEQERAEKRVAHWQEVATHAAEQCGRCIVPKINAAQNLKPWAEQITADLKLVLSPTANKSLSTLTTAFKSNATFSILIGPEGGFSKKELAFAEQCKFIPVNLGPRILRTETAALAAISILQARVGDLL